MKKRILSLCLAGTLALSLAAPASAAMVGSAAPQSTYLQNWPMTPASTNLTFSLIENKVRANNLTVKSLDETIASMEAMDWDDLIDELEDGIDKLESQISYFSATMTTVQSATTLLASTLTTINNSLDSIATSGIPVQDLTSSILGINNAFSDSMQLATMQSTLTSLESQLEELEDQAADYEKTVADMKRQFSTSIDQLIIGAESYYAGILSTELQLESLNSTIAMLERTLQLMELRYQQGYISKLTLAEFQANYNSALAGVEAMNNALTAMYASLQSLLGETPTGRMTLSPLPKVTAAEVQALSYADGLAKAKEASYDLYAAARTVEDAEDDMNDARRDNGKNSYQYKMAEHTYQAALYSQTAAIQNFELAFLNLYNSLTPALATYTTAEGTLAYEELAYQAAQLKHQLGNLSANALADAKDTYETAKRDFTSAEMDLFTAYQNYKNAVDHGIVSSNGG